MGAITSRSKRYSNIVWKKRTGKLPNITEVSAFSANPRSKNQDYWFNASLVQFWSLIRPQLPHAGPSSALGPSLCLESGRVNSFAVKQRSGQQPLLSAASSEPVNIKETRAKRRKREATGETATCASCAPLYKCAQKWTKNQLMVNYDVKVNSEQPLWRTCYISF